MWPGWPGKGEPGWAVPRSYLVAQDFRPVCVLFEESLMSIRPRLALLALAACVSSACTIDLDAAQYTAKEDKSFTVTGKADITLKTFDGSISVMAWDKSQVA